METRGSSPHVFPSEMLVRESLCAGVAGAIVFLLLVGRKDKSPSLLSARVSSTSSGPPFVGEAVPVSSLSILLETEDGKVTKTLPSQQFALPLLSSADAVLEHALASLSSLRKKLSTKSLKASSSSRFRGGSGAESGTHFPHKEDGRNYVSGETEFREGNLIVQSGSKVQFGESIFLTEEVLLSMLTPAHIVRSDKVLEALFPSKTKYGNQWITERDLDTMQYQLRTGSYKVVAFSNNFVPFWGPHTVYPVNKTVSPENMWSFWVLYPWEKDPPPAKNMLFQGGGGGFPQGRLNFPF